MKTNSIQNPSHPSYGAGERLRDLLRDLSQNHLDLNFKKINISEVISKHRVGRNVSSRLEELGIIKTQGEGIKKQYAITPIGQEMATSAAIKWSTFVISTAMPSSILNALYGDKPGPKTNFVTQALITYLADTLTRTAKLTLNTRTLAKNYGIDPYVPVLFLVEAGALEYTPSGMTDVFKPTALTQHLLYVDFNKFSLQTGTPAALNKLLTTLETQNEERKTQQVSKATAEAGGIVLSPLARAVKYIVDTVLGNNGTVFDIKLISDLYSVDAKAILQNLVNAQALRVTIDNNDFSTIKYYPTTLTDSVLKLDEAEYNLLTAHPTQVFAELCAIANVDHATQLDPADTAASNAVGAAMDAMGGEDIGGGEPVAAVAVSDDDPYIIIRTDNGTVTQIVNSTRKKLTKLLSDLSAKTSSEKFDTLFLSPSIILANQFKSLDLAGIKFLIIKGNEVVLPKTRIVTTFEV